MEEVSEKVTEFGEERGLIQAMTKNYGWAVPGGLKSGKEHKLT